MASSDDDIRGDLERVEQLIASLTRKESEWSEETPDSADAASGLTSAAEDEAVLEQLRARRDRLKAQLGEDPDS
jgi:histidinol-phosphate/aromatic aminotransferase/cobyric acid decarboxylase-like protein